MTRILQRSAALVLCFLASASTENQHQRDLKQHYEHLSNIAEFSCGEPQVRVIPVHKLFSESQTYGKAYFPDVTVLSRCDECSGSCDSDTKCGPKESVTVTLPFKVTFLEHTNQHKKGSWIIEFHELLNHTLCECIHKDLNKDACSEGSESRLIHNYEIDDRISRPSDQGNSGGGENNNGTSNGGQNQDNTINFGTSSGGQDQRNNIIHGTSSGGQDQRNYEYINRGTSRGVYTFGQKEETYPDP